MSELQHPSYNPRRISEFDFNNLVQSIREFGDLSGLVRNVTTGNLVGGNQRLEALKKLGSERIHITERMSDGPDKYGTVALGYALLPDGGTLAYREVLWTEEREKAANISANRVTGEWDQDLLSQLTYELSQLENGDDLLKLTGQTEDEISKLLGQTGPDPEPTNDQPDDGMQSFNVRLTDEQYVMLYQAIGMMKRERSLADEPNRDFDANALYYICKSYVENTTSQNIESPDVTPAQPDVPSPDAPLLDSLPADLAA